MLRLLPLPHLDSTLRLVRLSILESTVAASHAISQHYGTQ
jgi:hypothetical protein